MMPVLGASATRTCDGARRFQRDLWRLVDGRMGKSSAASSATVASELELGDAR
jgi:hypothetical protein